MAVRLDVELSGVRVQFSGADLVAACSRGLFLPFTRILGVRVMTRPDAVASSPRFPCPGFWWSRRYRAGCWGIGERRQLWSARQSARVVVIYLAGRPFHRVVLDVDEPEQAHRRIDAALLHSKKTSPRRSLRHHRRSTADRPEPDPARTKEGPQRQRPPGNDLASVPAHAAPPRRTDPGEQPPTPPPGPASAGPPAADLEGSCQGRTPSRESVSPVDGLAEHGQARTRSAIDDHDLPATDLSPPKEIDPNVAARLRLYEYRKGGSARHSGGPERLQELRAPSAPAQGRAAGARPGAEPARGRAGPAVPSDMSAADIERPLAEARAVGEASTTAASATSHPDSSSSH
jgi:hypothetical protein